MILVAAALLVIASAEDVSALSRVRELGATRVRGRENGSSLAYFEFAPASGAGMPAVACTGALPTGAKGEVMTFGRSSVAECYSNDGQTLTQVSTNQPRVSSGNALTSRLALWKEPAATNALLHGRGLDNVVWVKTNMTCTKTATGMRADVNGATTCTATAANATVCQTIAAAAAVRASSWHLKRRTGTGAVNLARDGITFLADIGPQLSPSLWRRAVPWSTPGCAGGNCIVLAGLSSSVLNPTICLQIASNGDAVDVDFVQDEAGWRSTSPLETTIVPFPRSAESAYFTIAATPIRSLRASILSNGYNNQYSAPIFAWQDGSNAFTIWNQSAADVNQNFGCLNLRTGLNQASGFAYLPTSSEAFTSMSCDVVDATSITWNQRYVTNSAATASTAVPAVTRIYLGGAEASGYGAPYDMTTVIRDACADPTAGRCQPVTDSMGSAIAAVGDSITYGLNQGFSRWVYTLGQALNRPIYNIGFTGANVAQCVVAYQTSVAGKGYTGLTVLCGVNDLIANTSAATIYASLTSIYDAAIASGLRLTIGTILPWSGYASWDAGKQTQTLALNTLILGYCAAHVGTATCVDFYNSALRSGTALAGAYDSGDGIHPNAAGATVMAGLWQAANP